MAKTTLQQAADIINRAKHIALVTVPQPDGDHIASLIALARALELLDKNVILVLPDPIPKPLLHLPITYAIRPSLHESHNYTFRIPLGDKTHLNSIEYEEHDRSLFVHLNTTKTLPDKKIYIHPSKNIYDLIIVAGADSLEDIAIFKDDSEPFFQTPLLLLHNKKIEKPYTGDSAIIPEALSLSEVITVLLENLYLRNPNNTIIDKGVATALLTGIQHNIDHIENSSISPNTHETIAKLLRYGADQEIITKALKEQPKNVHALRLLGSALQHCSIDQNKSFLFSHIPHAIHHKKTTLHSIAKELQKQFSNIRHILLSWEEPHDEHPALPRRSAIFISKDKSTLNRISHAINSEQFNDGIFFSTKHPYIAEHVAPLLDNV